MPTIETLTQLGLATGLTVMLVGFLIKFAWSQHKVITNHIDHSTQATTALNEAVRELTQTLREFREEMRRRGN